MSEPRLRASGMFRREIKSTLARWVVHRRHSSGVSSLRSEDEATHAWDGRRHFAEDYSFAVVQPHFGLVLRLEWLPGRSMHRVWVTVLDGDEVVAFAGGQRLVATQSKDRWMGGGLELDCVEPMKRWEARFVERLLCFRSGKVSASPFAEERVSVQLEFQASASPFCPGSDDDPDLLARRFAEATWDRRLLRTVRRSQYHGYCQTGWVRGTVAIGHRIHRVDARGLRQHGWGVRNWGASDEACQCFFVTADGEQHWIHHARFPFVTWEGGFVAAETPVGPLLTPIQEVKLRSHSEPSALMPHKLEAEIVHASGQRVIGGSAAAHLSFPIDTRGTVCLALLQGEREGDWGLWAGQTRRLPRRIETSRR